MKLPVFKSKAWIALRYFCEDCKSEHGEFCPTLNKTRKQVLIGQKG